MEKKCTKCGETKLLEEYHTHKAGKYGRRARCKECRKAYNKAYMKAYNQSEAGKAYQKAYNQSEAGKAALKRYRESEKGKAAKKAYRESEKGKATEKAYRESEKGKAYQKAYRKAYNQSEAGKAYKNAYNKSWHKNRYQTDPVYKLHCLLRSGFGDWIKGNTKTCRTEKYICCTYKELLDHLESQFEEGMSWENHGRGDNKWHIDHFKAQSRFDPTIEEEAYMCWHYTNLQPMWASENISCGNKKKPEDENRIWMDREIGWVS